MKIKTLGFIGFGEAAFHIAKGLRGVGPRVQAIGRIPREHFRAVE